MTEERLQLLTAQWESSKRADSILKRLPREQRETMSAETATEGRLKRRGGGGGGAGDSSGADPFPRLDDF